MQFRKDINGLRAIAVIGVVLFHFNAPWVPGGFAGVDVFFVISGFLMSRIIFRGIEQENFSILKFYVARANRIIPVLTVLCLALLVLGWFYITPAEYKMLGKHVGGSIGFFSNNLYLKESGYFDASSHEKWLLHTWSLSVEWQFYIIYPVMLLSMRKFMSVRAMKATILFATALGFIFCIFATYKFPNAAYYLLPMRAWELMLGGVAFLYPFAVSDNRKKLVEWLGLALIVGSYFLISKETPWPGYFSIFPVLGSFLIIQAQRTSIITSNVIFQKLGTWSYSIYLWHWPLVVAIYYFSLNDIFIYLGIALSILLGFLSNKYIEKIKFQECTNYKNLFFVKPLYMIIFLAGISSFLYNVNGYSYRIPSEINEIIDLNEKKEGARTWANHQKLDLKDDFLTAKKKILFIGDSQAGDFIEIMLSYGFTNNFEYASKVVSWDCGLFYVNPNQLNMFLSSKINTVDGISQCSKSMDRAFNSNLIVSADYIFIAQQWQKETLPYIPDAIEQLKKRTDAKVIVVGNKNILSKSSVSIYYETFILNDLSNLETGASKYIDQSKIKINSIMKKQSMDNGFYFIDLISVVCPNENKCLVLNGKGPIFYDLYHTTIKGNQLIANKVKKQMKNILDLP